MTGRSHFVRNQWIDGSGVPFHSTDPATGQVTWDGKTASESEANAAVEAAADAFEPWADLAVSDRLAFLEAFREQLTAHKQSVADAISRETGKPRWEALTEVQSMIGKIGISKEAYNDRCRVVTQDIAGVTGATRYKPHGVVAVFGPFNLPGHLPNGHIVPALLAGNTVVFKPSRQAPLVAVRMMELWEAVGLPSGVVNMVQGGRETGTALIQHPRIAGLFFTGSVETGRAIHRAWAGRPDKILALEMGGNNPLVVHEVGDVETAVYLTIVSAFITAGQRCTCARRLIVPDGPAGDTFLARLIEMTRTIRVGPCTDVPEPFMGPVISAEAAEKLLDAQGKLVAAGGRILVEMKRVRSIDTLLSPGIVDVTRVRDREDEELFGPFLQVIRVRDFPEAIREANRTAYGLAAGLLSDNKAMYDEFYRRVRAGVINWNQQTTGASGKMPFGGVGASGNHRPSGYFAADYCSYPIASIESDRLKKPDKVLPGLSIASSSPSS
ncbi:MAG: succinylglutamate-semialdehyde dehydrogenase [Desulfomonile tiedjei]|nr:succinylglutamate-semialdehyde dehydrogenase [Desulfomonile tiedjei]